LQKVIQVIVLALFLALLLWRAKEITYAERKVERTVLRVDRGNFGYKITYAAYTCSQRQAGMQEMSVRIPRRETWATHILAGLGSVISAVKSHDRTFLLGGLFFQNSQVQTAMSDDGMNIDEGAFTLGFASTRHVLDISFFFLW
jgi:hypothetical protein